MPLPKKNRKHLNYSCNCLDGHAQHKHQPLDFQEPEDGDWRWDENSMKFELTFPVSHHQHSVVDHPRVAEDLQGVRHTFLVELQKFPR